MKVATSCYLYARAGAPSTTSANLFYVSPGTLIEIDKVEIGDEIDGNSVWYHSKDGHYYWSGGFSEVEFSLHAGQFAELPRDLQMALIKGLMDRLNHKLAQTVAGYKGCGLGYKNGLANNPLALIIFVDVKLESMTQGLLPLFYVFKGYEVPTDVVEVGNPTTNVYHRNPHNPDRRLEEDDPYQIGGSVANSNNNSGYGSRTACVYRDAHSKNGTKRQFFILSCFHVLLPEFVHNSSPVVYPVTEKATAEKGIIPAKVKSTIRTVEGIITEGIYGAFYDYALIAIPKPDPLVNNVLHVPIKKEACTREEIDVLLKEKATVTTLGSTSHSQSGQILFIKSDIDLDFKHAGKIIARKYTGVIVTEKISEPGDSGAPVMDDSFRLVGYIVGNDDMQSYILPFYYLTKYKFLNIAT